MSTFRHLKIFLPLLIVVMMIASCNLFDDCEDGKNPVSEPPTDLEGCGSFTINQTGVVGDMIGVSYTGNYSKVNVLWGDNNPIETFPSTTDQPIAYHVYSKAGYYNVNVTVFSPRGYSCKCTKWVNISDRNNPNPASITFSITGTPSYGKPPLNVNFNHSFTATDGATCTNIAWDFGDGGAGQGMTTSHSYTNAGTYEVTATATDSYQRNAKAYATITVSENTPPDPANQPPVINITSDKIQVDVKGTINFTATASDPDGTVTNYDWVLGGGASESGPTKINVAHEYFETSGATYSVYCIVTDNDGATTQSNSISITIKPNLAPTVISRINGEPEGITPEVTEGDTVTIDMCNSTDPNAGDSIAGSRFSAPGFTPSSNTGTACSWTARADTTGTKAIVLHVTDSYSLESNAKSRQITVRTAEPRCVVTNATAQKIVTQYSLTGGTCSPYPSTSTYNNPGSGTTFGRGCPVTSGSKNFMTEGSGTYSVTWTMRVNATNCEASDRVTVTTQLQNVCGGSDVNNDIYIPNVVPNVYNTYSITLGGNCTNTNRRWNFLVDGVQLYYSILDSVNAH